MQDIRKGLLDEGSNKTKEENSSDDNNNSKPSKSLAFGKISDWKGASESEKLRVCRGFTDAYNNQNPPNKITATDLVICIDTATTGLDATDDITIQTMVILCMKEINKLN